MRIILISKIFSSYPSSFIDNQFEKFLIEYISSSSFLPVIDNETQLFLMRDKIMRQPTSRQSQVAMSTSIANIVMIKQMIQSILNQKNLQRTQEENQQIMEINYFFIIHMKNDLNHLNETCIKSMIMSLKIHQQWILELLSAIVIVQMQKLKS
jgi:hypothetical protein